MRLNETGMRLNETTLRKCLCHNDEIVLLVERPGKMRLNETGNWAESVWMIKDICFNFAENQQTDQLKRNRCQQE